MARQPVWRIQKELEYAQKREAYLKRTDRPVKNTVDNRPKKVVGYRSSLIKTSTNSLLLLLQATESSVTRLGGEAALGLVANTGTNLQDAVRPPRGFKPAKLYMVIGDATPTVRTAAGSGRRYIKYSANATGEQQSSFSAPVSKIETNVIGDEQQETATARAAALKSTAGQYGRIWFTPERLSAGLA